MGQTAGQLRAQITMLNKIGDDTTLKGQYAGTIRAHAQQLSRDLGKVADRYEQVSNATGTWSGALAETQRMSLTALQMAEGPHTQLQRLQAPQAPAGTATATQKQQYAADQQTYTRTKGSAEADLASAQRLLGHATGQRDAAGQQTARKITEASNDSLADSFWDHFKQAIGKIAGHLKLAATILGYIATAAAILAVILTGPLALVFLLVAAGLLLTELGIHTVLAATGNGSWLDVGLDIFALATLGYGSFAEGAVEGLEEGAETVARGVIQDSLETVGKALQEDAGNLAKTVAEGTVEGFGDLPEALDTLGATVRSGAEKLASKVVDSMTEGGENSALDTIKAVISTGSRKLADSVQVLQKLAEKLPGSTAIADAISKSEGFAVSNARVFLSGSIVDATDKVLSFAPGYEHLKDDLTAALPPDIGMPVSFVAEDWTPAGFAVKAAQWAS
jgi:hypothetical protein